MDKNIMTCGDGAKGPDKIKRQLLYHIGCSKLQ
jgi:hypothetical protein